jgi:hypothetical protein
VLVAHPPVPPVEAVPVAVVRRACVSTPRNVEPFGRDEATPVNHTFIQKQPAETEELHRPERHVVAAEIVALRVPVPRADGNAQRAEESL